MPNLPLVIWMIGLTLVIGLAAGMTASDLVHQFNAGWGRVLGEFALILLPSFALAEAITQRSASPASGVTVVASPIAGAVMICPDTAYAALSPIAGRQRLSVAFGSYAGFKLLFPAGPLIVATGLSIEDPLLMAYGFIIFVPVWVAGLWWANRYQLDDTTKSLDAPASSLAFASAFAPFGALLALLIVGAAIDLSSYALADFITTPKGALIVAATWAMLSINAEQRQICLNASIKRTGSLLLVIGAASAFGAILTYVIPITEWIPTETGAAGIFVLFLLTAAFKLVQGSSMATFAAVAPIAAPVVAASSLPATAAVLAICLGSFVAILPNDSFYWLVRRDALEEATETKTMRLLAGGATVQATVGLIVLLGLLSVGFV